MFNYESTPFLILQITKQLEVINDRKYIMVCKKVLNFPAGIDLIKEHKLNLHYIIKISISDMTNIMQPNNHLLETLQ